jgi:polysaccharide export outer membrane protein
MKLKSLFFFALMIGLCQFVLGQNVMLDPEPERGYLVGPGDEIAGRVLGEPQFDFVATIDEDGRFQVPFFEDGIMASCRTEKELRAEVTQLLAKYLKSPQISVRVTQRNSRPPATIYGEVRQPQQVVLKRQARLLELLAFAGGVTGNAGGTVQVFHTRPPMCASPAEESDWKAETSDGLDVPSRLYSLNSVKRGNEEANPLINPGDIIVVQEAAPIFIVGEVNSVGKLLLPEGGLPLTQAIAMVGGVKREAKTKDIKIYRLKADSKDREIISVNYDKIKKGEQKDVLLSPNDIVEVDKSKKSIKDILIGVATGGLQTFGSTLPTRVLY